MEAGHRCAIQTCKHPELDIHHIVPFKTVQEHSYDNLIALCPNCHRLAENGKIDRKSLRLYKQQLQASFRHSDDLEPQRPWGDIEPPDHQTQEYREERSEAPSYEILLTYPQLALNPFGKEVNKRIEGLVVKTVHSFRSAMLLIGPSILGDWTPSAAFLAGSSDTQYTSGQILSIRFSFSSHTWGAHPSHWTSTLNFLLEPRWPVCEVTIDDIFVDQRKGLALVSEYCKTELLAMDPESEIQRSPDWVRSGTSPVASNFRALNIVHAGLLITFDEYQVGPYIEGPSEVLVPFSVLREHLLPRLMSARGN